MKAMLEQFPAINPNPALNVIEDGTILYSNEAGELLLQEWGIKVGEKLPSSIRNIMHHVISTKNPEKIGVEVRDRSFLVVFSPLPDQKCVIISGFDISAQKALEEKLRVSEEKYRIIADNTYDWEFLMNSDGSFQYVSPSFERITGYTVKEFMDKPNLLQEIIHPDDQKVFLRHKHDMLLNHGDIEFRIITKDGETRWIHHLCQSVYDEKGYYVGKRGSNRDITNHKWAEERERATRNMLELIMNNIPQGIFWKDRNSIYLGCNNVFAKAAGLESPKSIVGKNDDELPWLPEQAKSFQEYDRKVMESDTPEYHIVEPQQEAGGRLAWIETNKVPLHDTKGNVIGILGTYEDITERKKVETALKNAQKTLERKVKERTEELEKAYESLKESKEGLAEAQRLAHVGNWDWNVLTGEGHWSDELYRIFGRNPQKSAPSYNDLLNYVHPDDRACVDGSVKKGLIKQPEPTGIDYRIILDNGEERIVHSRAEVIFNEKNIPIRVKGVIQDITEQKKAKDKIQLIANAVELSNAAILTFSTEGIVTSWNKGAEHVYGYLAQEIIGKDISITEPDSLKGEIKSFSERIKQGEKSCHYETLRQKKDGTLINISAALSPVFNESGELVAILAIARDITERVKAEQELAEINKIRIKEIHHRIKNNLQVISSLLDLQAEKIQNKDILEAFKESQSRIISMALIHEELYKGEGAELLNFSAYLQKLAENLYQTHRLCNSNVSLYIDVEENIFFDIDTAIPLGIVINELVSNSFKHAFIGRDKGEIQVKLFRAKNGNNKKEGDTETGFILTVSDNGIGIPQNFNIEDLDSLGMQLVISLVDQLDGKFGIKRNNGTQFTLKFAVKEKAYNQASGSTSQLFK
jgi:PAS domain S-box-containing protein